jgi:hypothetical protein
MSSYLPSPYHFVVVVLYERDRCRFCMFLSISCTDLPSHGLFSIPSFSQAFWMYPTLRHAPPPHLRLQGTNDTDTVGTAGLVRDPETLRRDMRPRWRGRVNRLLLPRGEHCGRSRFHMTAPRTPPCGTFWRQRCVTNALFCVYKVRAAPAAATLRWLRSAYSAAADSSSAHNFCAGTSAFNSVLLARRSLHSPTVLLLPMPSIPSASSILLTERKVQRTVAPEHPALPLYCRHSLEGRSFGGTARGAAWRAAWAAPRVTLSMRRFHGGAARHAARRHAEGRLDAANSERSARFSIPWDRRSGRGHVPRYNMA